MSGAILRAMLLGLLRDRGALIMAFVMPAVFFVVMAEIFTATGGADFTLRVAFYDGIDSDVSRRLVGALEDSDAVTLDRTGMERADDVRARVRDLAASLAGGRVLIVSSNGLMRSFLDLVPGALPARIAEGTFKVRTGHAGRLTRRDGAWTLQDWNVLPGAALL